jgi:hypothetical protein
MVVESTGQTDALTELSALVSLVMIERIVFARKPTVLTSSLLTSRDAFLTALLILHFPTTILQLLNANAERVTAQLQPRTLPAPLLSSFALLTHHQPALMPSLAHTDTNAPALDVSQTPLFQLAIVTSSALTTKNVFQLKRDHNADAHLTGLETLANTLSVSPFPPPLTQFAHLPSRTEFAFSIVRPQSLFAFAKRDTLELIAVPLTLSATP